MPKKHTETHLNRFDLLLLTGAAIFLCSALLRTAGTERLDAVRQKAAAFMTGELSAERVVRAFGAWDDPDELTAAVFHVMDENDSEQTDTLSAEINLSDRGFENEILRDSLFPDTVDRLAYLIDFPCKTPTSGIVTSGFGQRTDPLDGTESFHYGIDIAADEGTPIYAVSDGIVCETGSNSYGNYIVIEHDGGLQSLYAHCSRVEKCEGDLVEAGELIAAVGMTGRATGNHLHFELWRAGKILDPTAYLIL